jgi:hypothetical protein
MRKSKRKKLATLRREKPTSRGINLGAARALLASAVKAATADREAKLFIDSLPVQFDPTTKTLLRAALAEGIWKGRIKVVVED